MSNFIADSMNCLCKQVSGTVLVCTGAILVNKLIV